MHIVPNLSTIISAKRMTISEHCIMYHDKNADGSMIRKASKKTPRSQKLHHFSTKYHSPSKKTQKQWFGASSMYRRCSNERRSPFRNRQYPKGSSKKNDTKTWNFDQIENINEINVLSDKIAKMLPEKNVFLIGEIVKCLGKKNAIGLMKTTQAVQAMGGLELPHTPQKLKNVNRPRRTKRTVGGVFIQLAKETIPKDQWKKN